MSEEEIEQLKRLVLEADRVNKERFTEYGLCDCIDNNHRPYQSQWAADLIAKIKPTTA